MKVSELSIEERDALKEFLARRGQGMMACVLGVCRICGTGTRYSALRYCDKCATQLQQELDAL